MLCFMPFQLQGFMGMLCSWIAGETCVSFPRNAVELTTQGASFLSLRNVYSSSNFVLVHCLDRVFIFFFIYFY